MRSHYVLIALRLCAAGILSAAPITYDITVNTSSVFGDAGSLDFQFNPGSLVSQSASLQILNFATDGTLSGIPTLTGDVIGALSGPLTFDNGTGFNDYFEGFTFGSTVSFQVSLSGPALSSPDETSSSGSAFGFGMFSDPAGFIPILTSDPNGFASTISVNLDGTTTATSFSDQTTILPAEAAVPEPSSLGLLTLLLLILVLKRIARGEKLERLWDVTLAELLPAYEVVTGGKNDGVVSLTVGR